MNDKEMSTEEWKQKKKEQDVYKRQDTISSRLACFNLQLSITSCKYECRKSANILSCIILQLLKAARVEFIVALE